MSQQQEPPASGGLSFPDKPAPGNGKLRVMVLGWGSKPGVRQTAERTILPVLEQTAEVVAWDLTFEENLSACQVDLAIVVGGDGSILRAARQMGDCQQPVLGVNVGKLGFLASVTPQEFRHQWPLVCQRQYNVIRSLMLDCQVIRNGQLVASCLCLNEVLCCGERLSLLDIDLYVDDELVTTYSCDGLILSTPVGSTAHSLSAGGPILRQNLSVICISPIGPHTLTMRPVVDCAGRSYEMVIREPHSDIAVLVDGQPLCEIQPGDRVRVLKATPHFQMVEVPGHSYYRTLREKLNWGGTIRNQPGQNPFAPKQPSKDLSSQWQSGQKQPEQKPAGRKPQS